MPPLRSIPAPLLHGYASSLPGSRCQWVDRRPSKRSAPRSRRRRRSVGAWVVEASDEFVWILGYEGPEGFAAADARYYASAERAAVRPDPAQLIAASDHRMIRTVLPETG